MQEPKKIKLTNNPETPKVNLTLLPPINTKYTDGMIEDIPTTKENKTWNENHKQNNS